MYAYEYLKDFFRRENFTYDDNDNFYSFRYQGTSFVAFKNDGPYLQIVVICNTKGFDRSKLLEVCNAMNESKFVTKCTVNSNGECVWVSYEFYPDEHTGSDFFLGVLRILDVTSDEMFKKLNEE